MPVLKELTRASHLFVVRRESMAQNETRDQKNNDWGKENITSPFISCWIHSWIRFINLFGTILDMGISWKREASWTSFVQPQRMNWWGTLSLWVTPIQNIPNPWGGAIPANRYFRKKEGTHLGLWVDNLGLSFYLACPWTSGMLEKEPSHTI